MSHRVLDSYSKNQLTSAPVLVKLIALKELADDLGIGDVLSLMKVDVAKSQASPNTERHT